MANNEMTTWIGVMDVEGAHTNFYPIKKWNINGDGFEPLDDEDQELIKNNYYTENHYQIEIIDDSPKESIMGKIRKKETFGCMVTFCEDDFDEFDSSMKFKLSHLLKHKENANLFSADKFLRVIDANAAVDNIEGQDKFSDNYSRSSKSESLYFADEFLSTDRKTIGQITINSVEVRLIDGEQAFLKFPVKLRNDYEYVGPIGRSNGELIKPYKYNNMERFPKAYSRTIFHKNAEFFYYDGEPFNFDYVEPPYDFDYVEPPYEDGPLSTGGTTEKITETTEITEKRKNLIQSIKSYRDYDKNMIYNMLICITQGFLTVFAGEPGTGKTSICDKIAHLLGVSNKNDKNNRYLSISVERGWTSKNDLIGYLNPLDGKVVDITGLYKALETTDKEKREEGTHAPYLVLLDEANLSQMEYYWSNFIKLADDTARVKTPLHFGIMKKDDEEKKVEFMIPDWFKFLATINNDQTTESLSPRLLDRAWVVTLPTLDVLSKDSQDDNDNDCERISWEDLQQMFGGTTVDEKLFNQAIHELDEIYAVYKESYKPVSPRSKLAIEKYLKSALACFEFEKDDDNEKIKAAIDFVILQRLLPMLNGYVSSALKEGLKEILAKYPLSGEKFEKMCAEEDYTNSSYVNFFM